MSKGMTRKGMIQDRKNLPLPACVATRRQIILGAMGVFGGLGMGTVRALAGTVDEISHTCEAIHQEVVFKVGRKRVYEALTNAKQFDKVVQFSAAVQSGMVPGGKPVEVSPEVGGAFSAFGGHITGRHVELVPGERVVQAWRTEGWGPGQYSIARFELVEQGSGTKVVFDHTGFPQGQAQHLADGWKGNYWEPLEKYFAQG